MKAYTVGVNDDNLRLDRFIGKLLPHLPAPFIQKSLRQKKVRVNGHHQLGNVHVHTKDVVTLYYRPELFTTLPPDESYQLIATPKLAVIYEDEHLIVVNKPVGQSAHADAHGSVDTLLTHIQAYLYQSGAWRPEAENAFRPALCHRIDRNTRGLMMAAKTHTALTILSEKLRLHQIDKYYQCVVHGNPVPKDGTFKDFIVRKPDNSRVSVYAHPMPEGRTAITHYRTLSKNGQRTLLECRLETGRTHQIRAQLAFHGHPLLGDGKYGVLRSGEPRVQCLCAYKLIFHFEDSAGVLDYLKGTTIQLPQPIFDANSY